MSTTSIREISDLPPAAQKAFKSFLTHANKGLLHALDWERFYEFIRQCHREEARVTEEDVSTLLEQAGFEPSYAERIGMIYDHGRKILSGPRY